ncbi:MAG: hydantoinase B/oxoprolinase family protein [Chloroflexi bacterium]|nr:hydantoinase B/oxoprolinase family protein [Chloroflexota bacterium]
MNTGGPGRFRGGLNIVRDYEVLAADSRLSLWFERTVTPQWGLFGGKPGAVPKVIFEPGTEGEQTLLKINHLPITTGARLRAFTGGGGGYGPPWEREVWRVREDVLDGYVSEAAASSEYGVHFNEQMEIDEVQTRLTRAELTGKASDE